MRRGLSKRAQAAYLRKRLAEDIHPVDRQVLERKLVDLGCRCVSCGRKIENEHSVRLWLADGYGPECRGKQRAVA